MGQDLAVEQCLKLAFQVSAVSTLIGVIDSLTPNHLKSARGVLKHSELGPKLEALHM